VHEFRFRIIAGPAGTGIRNINFGGQAQAADEPGLPHLGTAEDNISAELPKLKPCRREWRVIECGSWRAEIWQQPLRG